MAQGDLTDVASVMESLDFTDMKFIDEPRSAAMPSTIEGLADRVAEAILVAEPEPAVSKPSAKTAEPTRQPPIVRQFTETYFVYGTKAQCGFEIMLVRIRDIDGRKKFFIFSTPCINLINKLYSRLTDP